MTAGPAPDGLLRPALQLAVDVARAGAAGSPPLEPPRALRPILRFAKLSDAVLASVRRALDEDEAFRARVGALADEDELGRAAWLFVTRPEGWEDELAALAGEARSRADAEREEKEERSARKRVASAEAATARAEAVAAKARAEAEAASAELATERRDRRAAQEEAARLARRVASLEGERDSARRRAEEAGAEAGALRAELEAVRARLQTEAAEAALLRARPVPEPEPRPEPATSFDVAGASAAVAAAASAAAALGRALADASAALGGATPATPAPAGPATGTAAGAPSRSPRPAAPPRRRPPPLPPGVHDDTAEAAAHLVRVPGVLVMIDGYNAAKTMWPDLALPDQRERLLDALAELEARTGAAIHVVFDGADLPPARTGPRRRVRVSFSPAGVEADDVILEMLDAEPVANAVVVASSDRRVQDGARARGAASINIPQLAGVLRRA